jgi:hypothetical protein
MKKQNLVIIFSIMALGLIAGAYQYIQIFQAEMAGAYNATKPANGHSWSEMQCTEGLCVTADNKVGVGTDSPSVKFEVNGTIKGTDVCNATGNCLSALATLTNACGAAATTYAYSASAYSGTYCVMGTSTPVSPAFPAAGNSTTWTCPVTSGSPISCTATHSPAPVAGVCGAAATAYSYSASVYSGALCSTGTASPASPAFPAVGSSSSWSCLGTNGGSSPSCTASRNNPLPLVNSVHTEASCVAAGGEVVASDVSYSQCRFNASSCPSGWTWYNNWSTTSTGASCGALTSRPPCITCGSVCTPIGHAWSTEGRNSCAASSSTPYNCGAGGSCSECSCCQCPSSPITCYANLIQVGCY